MVLKLWEISVWSHFEIPAGFFKTNHPMLRSQWWSNHGFSPQNQHGLSFLLNLSLMIGLALILYPLFVFSHQSFSDENAHVCVFSRGEVAGCAATFTWRSQFNLPATEFTEHCSNRWIWVSPETQTLVSLLMHVISDINSSWKERLAAAPKQTSILSLEKNITTLLLFWPNCSPPNSWIICKLFPISLRFVSNCVWT